MIWAFTNRLLPAALARIRPFWGNGRCKKGETARSNGYSFQPGPIRAVPPLRHLMRGADRVANQVGAGAAGHDLGIHQQAAFRRFRPDTAVLGIRPYYQNSESRPGLTGSESMGRLGSCELIEILKL